MPRSSVLRRTLTAALATTAFAAPAATALPVRDAHVATPQHLSAARRDALTRMTAAHIRAAELELRAGAGSPAPGRDGTPWWIAGVTGAGLLAAAATTTARSRRRTARRQLAA
jgi:hypothetical protein